MCNDSGGACPTLQIRRVAATEHSEVDGWDTNRDRTTIHLAFGSVAATRQV